MKIIGAASNLKKTFAAAESVGTFLHKSTTSFVDATKAAVEAVKAAETAKKALSAVMKVGTQIMKVSISSHFVLIDAQIWLIL